MGTLECYYGYIIISKWKKSFMIFSTNRVQIGTALGYFVKFSCILQPWKKTLPKKAIKNPLNYLFLVKIFFVYTALFSWTFTNSIKNKLFWRRPTNSRFMNVNFSSDFNSSSQAFHNAADYTISPLQNHQDPNLFMTRKITMFKTMA